MFKIQKLNNLVLVLFFLQSTSIFTSDLANSTNHIKTIIFGAGCFWSVEKKFQETFGVIDVESGYADGANIKPLYKEIIKRENRFNPDNYAEVVRVTYNNNKTNLENLLKTSTGATIFKIRACREVHEGTNNLSKICLEACSEDVCAKISLRCPSRSLEEAA